MHIEIRQAWVITGSKLLWALRGCEKWPKLAAIVKIDAERILPEKCERNIRYYLASFPIQAQQSITSIRSHGQIANCLHWVLDNAFREAECRLRKDDGAQSFAILRHIALNLLKQESSS